MPLPSGPGRTPQNIPSSRVLHEAFSDGVKVAPAGICPPGRLSSYLREVGLVVGRDVRPEPTAVSLCFLGRSGKAWYVTMEAQNNNNHHQHNLENQGKLYQLPGQDFQEQVSRREPA